MVIKYEYAGQGKAALEHALALRAELEFAGITRKLRIARPARIGVSTSGAQVYVSGGTIHDADSGEPYAWDDGRRAVAPGWYTVSGLLSHFCLGGPFPQPWDAVTSAASGAYKIGVSSRNNVYFARRGAPSQDVSALDLAWHLALKQDGWSARGRRSGQGIELTLTIGNSKETLALPRILSSVEYKMFMRRLATCDQSSTVNNRESLTLNKPIRAPASSHA